MTDGLLLSSLDGANPLAYLAAVGTLRLLHNADSDARVQMRWERSAGAWRPRVHGLDVDEDGFCKVLAGSKWAPVGEFESLGKNITVPVQIFGDFVLKAYEQSSVDDRRTADFAAAFGNESREDREKGRIEYTDFCFITGSGHQDFLGTAKSLAAQVTEPHLRNALFEEWRFEKSFSMRWDPSDTSEYALQWDDPGPQGAWAVWGLNRLAFEALPYFPTMPVDHGLATTGFQRRSGKEEFTWAIWTRSIGAESVRSLVSLPALQEVESDKVNSFHRDGLRAMGIEEIYRSRRDRIGQGANFKVSFRPARAV